MNTLFALMRWRVKPGMVSSVRTFALLSVLGAACTLPLPAQTHGYGFLGGTFAGTPEGAFRYGIGGEGRVAPRVTLGGEIGGINKKNFGGVVLSGMATFHPSVSSRGNRWDPFLGGGLTFAPDGDGPGMFLNIGGGVNYWWQRNFGFRFEIRGYPKLIADTSGFAEFRFGVAFR